MGDIFISYATEDRSRIGPLIDELRKRGWGVWWDRSVPVGGRWDRHIEAALASSSCVIVIWSEISVESDWVRSEADEGKRRGILVPILIDQVTIPLAFRWLQAANLAGWRGEMPNPEFEEVANAVCRVLEKTDKSSASAGASKTQIADNGPTLADVLRFSEPANASTVEKTNVLSANVRQPLQSTPNRSRSNAIGHEGLQPNSDWSPRARTVTICLFALACLLSLGVSIAVTAWLILGSAVGFISSKIVNKTGFDPVKGALIGGVGAVIGGWLYISLGFSSVTGLTLYSLIVAIIGSTICIVIYRFISHYMTMPRKIKN
jgi:uncharacterized membrane protein YeaQ/YmgE (transglycosylase-associated protein family)